MNSWVAFGLFVLFVAAVILLVKWLSGRPPGSFARRVYLGLTDQRVPANNDTYRQLELRAHTAESELRTLRIQYDINEQALNSTEQRVAELESEIKDLNVVITYLEKEESLPGSDLKDA